jgi:NADH-quinone oxidoreductase subunit J
MHLLATTTTPIDGITFIVASAIVLLSALGVVLARNPVHSALMLVLTLFGVAVLFVAQQANFLAAVQVIVYAGAIVVLFLFVIMLLGVDQTENIQEEPLRGQRPLVAVLVLIGIAEFALLARSSHWVTGQHQASGSVQAATHGNPPVSDVTLLARSIFTRYLLPFEATSVLLVIAVVGAVTLARKPDRQVPQGPHGRRPIEEEATK